MSVVSDIVASVVSELGVRQVTHSADVQLTVAVCAWSISSHRHMIDDGFSSSRDHDHMDVIDGVASVGLFWLLVSSVISCP